MHESEHYADKKSMNTLRRYLCSLALPTLQDKVYVEACRNCVSQCAFGKRYVALYDSGAPMKNVRGPYKPRKKKSAAAKEKPVNVDTVVKMTEKAQKRNAETKTTDGGAHTWQPARVAIS